MIARQFIVSGWGKASNVTASWNEFDGRTPYSVSCDGTHYWMLLLIGAADSFTLSNNWIHHFGGRSPHTSTANATMALHMINNYFEYAPNGRGLDAGAATTAFRVRPKPRIMLPMRTHVSSTGLLIRSDPAQSFAYPTHIDRACLDALPSQPGVYIFRDGEGAALYIGKSVNIRTRVLSHLRTQDEGQMLARTRHIDFELCGGEIGALLRESQLIKQMQPVFNQKLRRLREMCSLRLSGGRPQVVFAREVDFARTEGLYGLFGSRKAALEVLRGLAESVRLCCAVIGLEKTAAGRPCFGHQLGRCLGACVGVESSDEHAERLLTALEPMHIAPWPFAGAVGIVEVAEGRRFVHLVDHWHYLGQGAGAAAPPEKRRKATPPAGFDIDVYQILVRPLLKGSLTVEAP